MLRKKIVDIKKKFLIDLVSLIKLISQYKGPLRMSFGKFIKIKINIGMII